MPGRFSFGRRRDELLARLDAEAAAEERRMPLGGMLVGTAIKAVYEDGVLKPKEPLELAEHSEVEVLVFARLRRAATIPPARRPGRR